MEEFRCFVCLRSLTSLECVTINDVNYCLVDGAVVLTALAAGFVCAPIYSGPITS